MLMWLTISPKSIYFFKFENKPNFNDILICLHPPKSIKILRTWGTKTSLQEESQLIVLMSYVLEVLKLALNIEIVVQF